LVLAAADRDACDFDQQRRPAKILLLQLTPFDFAATAADHQMLEASWLDARAVRRSSTSGKSWGYRSKSARSPRSRPATSHSSSAPASGIKLEFRQLRLSNQACGRIGAAPQNGEPVHAFLCLLPLLLE